MHRFFVPIDFITQQGCVITGSDAEHIRSALRLKKGDAIQICDGFGSEYAAIITGVGKDIEVSFTQKLENLAEPKCSITLYQGIPKLAKMETVVQKCVELGVKKVVPVLNERCVSKPTQNDKKQLRWQKIAMEAAKQSGRGIIPAVMQPTSFGQSLALMKAHELLIVCYENEQHVSLKSVLEGQVDIGLVIGPEGGLTSAEVQQMMDVGGKTVTLGKRIMRTETAGMAVLSAIMFFMGEME
jgi:16S rRNA (uracil1498-N3)-methyltransferase